jgi:hypothetical protein
MSGDTEEDGITIQILEPIHLGVVMNGFNN